MIILAQWISDRGQRKYPCKIVHDMMNLVENELADTVQEGEGQIEKAALTYTQAHV